MATSETIRVTLEDHAVVETNIFQQDGVWKINLRTWGCGRPSLMPPGSRKGTKNVDEARALAGPVLRDAVARYRASRGLTTPLSTEAPTDYRALKPMEQVDELLKQRVAGKSVREGTAAKYRQAIEFAWLFFNGTLGRRRWEELSVQDLTRYLEFLRAHVDERTKAPLTTRTQARHCTSLLTFLSHAWRMGFIDQPDARLFSHPLRPSVDSDYEGPFLELHEAGLLLETSFDAYKAGLHHHACPHWPWILAVMFYTGCREAEALGLMVDDVRLPSEGSDPEEDGWGHGVLRMGDHPHRPLKNKASIRDVPLWPALAALLREYLRIFRPPADGLLFPRPGVIQLPGKQRAAAMWRRLDGSMTRDVKAAKIAKNVTDHAIRRTYVTARVRMLKLGERRGELQVVEAVSPKEIAVEVGHRDEQMVRRVYDRQRARSIPGFEVLDYAAVLAAYRKHGTAIYRDGRLLNGLGVGTYLSPADASAPRAPVPVG
jgi:integrase